jgi:DNA ligase D-like protein (predicted polymerase)
MSSPTACTPLSVLNTTVCPCAVSTCQLTATSMGSKSVSGIAIGTVATSASMSPVGISEQRDGVDLTNLDQPLGPDSGATKRDLVDYLEAIADRMLPGLAGRPLTVLRVLRGRAPFMQKNVPEYTPDWVRTVRIWAEASKREVRYAVCDNRRTLLWFANQRAIEYHPTLGLAESVYRPTYLVLDLDPPRDDDFSAAVAVAHLVRQALNDSGLAGAVKTSGAKGLHVFVPIDDAAPVDDVAAATRALAARAEALDPSIATTAFIVADRGGKVFVDSTRTGGATVVAAYSPRLRPGTPVSFPLDWSDLDRVSPGDFTVRTALDALDGRVSWANSMPAPQPVPSDLIEQGRAIPVARVAAMHEGKRRARRMRHADGS